MSGGVFFLIMIVLILLGLPIAIGIGFSSIIYILTTGIKPLVIMGPRLVSGMDSFALLAITLFVMAGCMMEAYGLSGRLIDFSTKFFGRIPGSTGTVALITCAIFAALTGSGPATVAAIGAIMLPLMIENGYKKKDAVGLVAVGGALGPLIPPSITMIVYGTAMGLSVPEMFVGAVGPGLLMLLALVITNVIMCRKNGVMPAQVNFTPQEKWKSFKGAIGAIMMPVIVLGGIYSGIFTPTEASAIAVVYCALLGIAYRKFTWANFKKVCIDTIHTSAMILFIIAAASLFGLILTTAQIPQKIVESATGFIGNPYLFLVAMTIIVLIAGALLETTTATLILAPIVIPVGLALGLDPLHLGVVWCLNLIIGLCTPPFGLNLFTASSMSGLSFLDVIKGALPYLAASLVVLLLCTFVPQTVLFLPRLIYGG